MSRFLSGRLRRPSVGMIALALVVVTSAAAERVAPRDALEPNQYTWHPEVSPKGPVLVVVSLPQQTAYVYRNGVLIGRSTVSSGREGEESPTGGLAGVEKKRKHEMNM